jgi:hypothetical protein
VQRSDAIARARAVMDRDRLRRLVAAVRRHIRASRCVGCGPFVGARTCRQMRRPRAKWCTYCALRAELEAAESET